MSNFIKKLFYKRKGSTKKYKLFGLTLVKISKKPTKKIIKILGIKFTKKISTKVSSYNFEEFFQKQDYKCIKDGIISLDTIKSIISSENIKVISFDIFDTLLMRPVINPTDIFYLINEKLKTHHKINFIKYRLKAERKLNNPNANIDDIYNFIEKKYNLSKEQINIMKEEEKRCEAQILSIRKDIFSIYEYAINLGKKVIATSDMYLPENFLKNVVINKGYKRIETFYISNKYKKRKDTTELYKVIIKNEKVSPSEILHIGDNYNSDYLCAIRAGLTAIYYPSIKDIIFSSKSIYKDIYTDNVSLDPYCRIILGYTFNNFFSDLSVIKNKASVYEDFNAFIKLSIAPVILHIANFIANNKTIQNEYKQILFASRDGFLPQIAYDLLSKHKQLIPSKYVYAGRRAYWSANENDFISYIEKTAPDKSEPFSLKGIINAYINDDIEKNKLLNSLSKDELLLDFNQNKQKIISILQKHEKTLNEYIKTHRDSAYNYYSKIISNNNREIIFDCGYSGSISSSLINLLNKPIDKIYLWETEKNTILDKKNNTHTFLIMNENQLFIGNNILYEEIFSPLEGGCLGFNNAEPIKEDLNFNSQMKSDYESIKNIIIDFMKNFIETFGEYTNYCNIKDTYTLQKMLDFALNTSPYNEITLLNNIEFPDPIFIEKNTSLCAKIQKYQKYSTVFDKTGFNNPAKIVKPEHILSDNNFKIGIHCHLYNIHLYEEILHYLKDFPQAFDLIFTVCKKEHKKILENIFSKNTIKNLNKLIILTVENRGRDVAPWLVSTKDYQQKYDIFCHIHGKESTHINFGTEWRRYLYDNLINNEAVIDIINILKNNTNIGCLFPSAFPKLKELCIIHNIDQNGMFNEIKTIKNLIKDMNIQSNYLRNDIFFSEGTMMWYRPCALKKLFDLNLKYSDFPEEPIGVGGTIAHAIERLPAYVCEKSGYLAKTYNKN